MANVYVRDKVWWGRVTVAGREHRRSLRTADKKEAERRLGAWVAKLEAAAHFGIERHTWKESVVRFFDENPRELKPSTARRYMSSVVQVGPILNHLRLDQIDARAISEIANRRGPTNATRRRDLVAVSAILATCVSRWRWLDRNPAHDFDRRALRERPPGIVLPTDEEIAAFVAACHMSTSRRRGDHRGTLGFLAETLLLTGMRLEEAGGLPWARVDLARGSATLTVTKNGRPRTIDLSAQAVGTLRRVPRALPCPWVFWHSTGRPYANLSSRLASIRKRLGLGWRTHDLRHVYAVRYLRDGGSIYRLRDQLGHSSVAVTEGYLQCFTPAERERIRAIG